MKRRKHKEKNKHKVESKCNVCGVDTSDLDAKWKEISREFGPMGVDQHPDAGKIESAIDEGCCLACDAAMNEQHRKEYKKKFRRSGKPRSPSYAVVVGQ